MVAVSEGLDLVRVEHVDGPVLLREEQVRTLEREKLRELELPVGFRGDDALAEKEFFIFGLEVEREKERFEGAAVVDSIAAGLLLDVVQELAEQQLARLLVAVLQWAP